MTILNKYNFSAGPAILPEAVLQTAQAEMLDYNGTGSSVMTMSHRSEAFISILHHAEQDLRQLLHIPNNYKILFMQGGASAQFNMLVMNLANGFKRVDSVVSGNWSRIAHSQMGKLSNAEIHLAAHGGDLYNYTDVPAPENWDVDPNSAFVHYCINETVHGLQYRDIPKPDGMPPIVCDMSSEILSRPINIADFGVIYAGAQKNIGPSGATIVIIREDLLERCSERIPDVWNYQSHISRQGMYNTPATYPIYISGLVFRWLQVHGGVEQIQAINTMKAETLYSAIDNSNGFYTNNVKQHARSHMNVIFHTPKKELDTIFVQQANAHGLCALQGYQSIGGMRASIYNAMPIQGVEALVSFMQEFQRRYG
ncbi:phosphoserine transaminase [Snodgrassella alvi]|uniref:3-phosphoserine/phosphohydroxythreonine transaminase n=1 Tax=Snodgrassella alvi TaxID=1196083 RepID=UPI000C1E93D7|nr:3-phosphoserine/phosphohydroxythreonine transaminase [Snodgrassella alvi]PIT07323.1 phosphoserine transaminase [Snodgrassella alvi]PIT57104.1 phosphoserine transaminase [Snodgrassella alvi]